MMVLSYHISSPSNPTTASEASPAMAKEKSERGEIRRFLDEVGYLFKGLDPKCIGPFSVFQK
jgi:hypothetical protein